MKRYFAKVDPIQEIEEDETLLAQNEDDDAETIMERLAQFDKDEESKDGSELLKNINQKSHKNASII